MFVLDKPLHATKLNPANGQNSYKICCGSLHMQFKSQLPQKGDISCRLLNTVVELVVLHSYMQLTYLYPLPMAALRATDLT